MTTDFLDACDWPLVDAVFLHMRSGCEAVADVPLPDGSVPVAAAGGSGVRLMLSEWESYRALCRVRRGQLVAL
jgi:hypothetical protein